MVTPSGRQQAIAGSKTPAGVAASRHINPKLKKRLA
jgi:hypothetical protein